MTSNEKVCRWGFMGTATIARKNWLAVKNSGNGRIVAVASRSGARSQAFIDECQSTVPFVDLPRAVEGYQELLAQDDIEAVYIPLPTGIRKEWVIQAAESGKHVLCEKPCAKNLNDLAEMVDACRANGVQFMDGVMFMHSQRLASVREAIGSGQQLGQLRRMVSQFSFNGGDDFAAGNIRAEASLEPLGCLGDLGWYTIRFALWAMNYQMPTHVVGRILRSFPCENNPQLIPTEITAELRFAGGVTASFYTSFVTDHQQWVNLSGTDGQLFMQDFVLPYAGDRICYGVLQSEFRVVGCDFSMVENQNEKVIAEDSHGSQNSQEANMFRRFSGIVSSGRLESHWPEIALSTQRVMDAVMLSAAENSRTVQP